MFLNQVSFDGTHLLWTLVDNADEMEKHPVTPLVRLFAPGGEFEFRPADDHEVIAAWRSDDLYEVVVVKHVTPHSNPEDQKRCNEHPCVVVVGGEIQPSPFSVENAMLEAEYVVSTLEDDEPDLVFKRLV